MKARLLLVLAAAAVPVLLAGCGTDVTADRLAANVGPTFRNMYLVQQKLTGGTPRATADTARAHCVRGAVAGPNAAPSAGPDAGGNVWTCAVHWPATDGHTETLGYEVTVQPNGCYTAQGPSSYVGAQTVTDADGRSVVNPLYEFDGCLAPH